MIPLKMTVRTIQRLFTGHLGKSDVSAAAVERTATRERERPKAHFREHFSEIFVHFCAFILAFFLHTSVLTPRRKVSSPRAGSV